MTITNFVVKPKAVVDSAEPKTRRRNEGGRGNLFVAGLRATNRRQNRCGKSKKLRALTAVVGGDNALELLHEVVWKFYSGNVFFFCFAEKSKVYAPIALSYAFSRNYY